MFVYIIIQNENFIIEINFLKKNLRYDTAVLQLKQILIKVFTYIMKWYISINYVALNKFKNKSYLYLLLNYAHLVFGKLL